MTSQPNSALAVCKCGHPAESHIYPGTALFGDCNECRCELYNPPGGLRGVPLHPLFTFTEAEFRMVACTSCGRFRVLPEGVCEACGWDDDNDGPSTETRPNFCRHSPTREHDVPFIKYPLRANYCRFCLRTLVR
jgi:hypothetical protein